MAKRSRISAICVALTVLLALISGAVGISLPGARAQVPNRVGLVVRFGDGSIITRCVEFGEPGISGYDALTRAGLDVVAAFDSGKGAAVCSIEGTGCPVEDCLTCATPDYWSYWHLVGGAWSYSPTGAGSYTVRTGDVEGWSWGPGEPPPVVPFDQICAPPSTNTPPPTDIPPTNTPVPPTDTPPPPADTPVPPTATAPPSMPMVWFRLDDNPIAVGACTTVRWDTSNTQEVYLDGESVSANSSREVCPTRSQEYRLRVVAAAEEQTYTLLLGVTGMAPTETDPQQPSTIPPTSPPPTPAPTKVTSLSATATPQAAAFLAPSPLPTVQSTATTSPSSTPAHEAALPSAPSLASSSAPITQPTRTPLAPNTTPLTTDDRKSIASDKNATSALVPIGYIVFSLIVGGLLGWLVFIVTRRK